MIIELTELEKKVVKSFITAFNYDNAEDEKMDNATALDIADVVSFTGLTTQIVKGVFGSLHKKEILIDWNEPNMKGVSNITNLGIDTYYIEHQTN